MKLCRCLLAILAFGLWSAVVGAVYAQDGTAVKPSTAQITQLQSQLEKLPTAAGAGLLLPPPAPIRGQVERSQSAQSEPGVARVRAAMISPDYLDGLMREPELQMSADGNVAGTLRTYVLNLFDDVSVRLVKKDLTRDILGNDVWRGALVGPQGGEATLVISNGRVTGKVRVGGKTYGIQPAADGAHDVVEYDESTLPTVNDDVREPPRPPDAAPLPEPAPPAPPRSDAPRSIERGQVERPQAVAATNLSLLVVYTPRALSLRPNISSDISLFASNLNTALSNSAINVQVTLVGSQQVAYTESAGTTMATILDDATDGAGDFARIAQLRADLHADLLQVWGVPSDACGLAWINSTFDSAGSNISYYARRTTSVVTIDARGGCIVSSYDAASHEVGHNLGAQHDRYTQNLQGGNNTAGPQGYNFGYIDLTGGFSDLMAYGSQSHIPYFSNPNVTYNGRPVGIQDSLATAANNARRIGEISPYVAQMDSFLQQPRLGIFLSGGSGSNSITGPGVTCSSTCTNFTFTPGQAVTLTAVPASGWNFAGWGSNLCLTTTASATGGTCTIVMNGWAYVSPSFTQGTVRPTLTISREGVGGGTVTSSPSGINCGSTCSASFASGATVVLTATPNSGSSFSGWSNGCTGSGTCTVTMSAARSATATFALTTATVQALSVSVSGSGTVSSSPSGINCGSTCSANFTPGTSVTLSAVPGSDATFNGWGGACSGTGSCTVSMSAARSVTAAFTDNQSTSQSVTVNVTGGGTVASSPAGLSCRSSCSASFTRGSQITFTATPSLGWVFAGWSACPGTSTCTVTANAGTSVSAVFVEPSTTTVTLGSVFSTSQSSIQSHLRFFNTGGTPGVVQVTLSSSTTGAVLGQWTSPAIPAGAARQFFLGEIEDGTGQSFSKPGTYSVKVQPQMSGYLQHVLFRPSDGTLTNLSTCDAGVMANSKQLINVHSSILDYGYPSTVVVSNTGSSSVDVDLGVYDAVSGAKLGTGNYTVRGVMAGAQVRVAVAAMEEALGISPTTAGLYHYVIRAESDFTGFLQHLVNNLRASVITDMTTLCALSPVTTTLTPSIRMSSVYSSSQTAIQSYLRFYNTSATAGTVRVTFDTDNDGRALAQWTSPPVPAGAARQFSVEEIEHGAGISSSVRTPRYGLIVEPQIPGYVQHVLYRPSDGTLTNLSTCDTGVGTSAKELINVHTSILDYGFPSVVLVNNTGTDATSVSLGVYNAVTGVRMGSGLYTVPSIPAGGQAQVTVAAMEAALGIVPSSSLYHYVVKAETSFTGFLQHLVNNIQVGVITDMTTMCGLNNDDATPDSTATNGAITAGTPITGKLDFAGDTDWYRVVLARGTRYHIDLQGASSSNGTLADPILRVHNDAAAIVATDDDSGTGLDSALDFTEPNGASQVYYLEVSGYRNSTGSYRLSIAGDDYQPDSIATNGRAVVGSTTNGSINWAGDRDWFQVSLTAGQSYSFGLLGATSNQGTLADPYLRLMNSNGTQIAQNDDGYSACCGSLLAYTPTASGTYYVVAGALNDAAYGSYALTMQQGTQIVTSVTPLALQGSSSFTITFGITATLRSERITNLSSTRTSGTLRLELWYLNAPYGGTATTGYKVAQTSLGTLAAGNAISGTNVTTTPLTTPPSGTYYAAFLLTEYNPSLCTLNGGFCTAAYLNFSSTQQVR